MFPEAEDCRFFTRIKPIQQTPPDKSLIQAATGELSPETVIVPVPFSDMNATDAESYSVADSESSFAATVASDESLPSLLSDE